MCERFRCCLSRLKYIIKNINRLRVSLSLLNYKMKPTEPFIFSSSHVKNSGYYMTARGYEFIFECSTRYLTSERSSLVRCRVEHQKINSYIISTSGHVIFCLLHKHTNDDVFEDFPKISDHFPKIPKIFQNFSEGKANVSEHFSDIFRRLPKISEDFREGTDDVSIIQQHI